MARVVVAGAGFAGLAAAARLAKLGHAVTLLEARDRVGGALGLVEADGFCWDSGPAHTVLPAVVRDLFRKSGRPLEREVDLVPVARARRHVFDDGSVLDLPSGSRGDQHQAVEAVLGPAQADAWTAYVDQFRDVWSHLRRDWLEQPWSADHASKESRDLLRSRMTLHKLVRHDLRDPRLRDVALQLIDLEGQEPRNVPAFWGMWTYVEQNFGTWTVPGGLGRLAGVLADRMTTRRVEVHLGCAVGDVVVRGERAVGVRTSEGEVDADVVVVAVDPRRLPLLAPLVARTTPTTPPVITHLGLVGELPDLPHETVLHGDPTVVIRTGGSAPPGGHAWTLLGRGRLPADMLDVLAASGLDVRAQVRTRVDRSPRDLVVDWNGSPDGVWWQGRATLRHRLGVRTPFDGVYVVGAHGTPGAGIAQTGLSAAQAAQLVGPA